MFYEYVLELQIYRFSSFAMLNFFHRFFYIVWQIFCFMMNCCFYKHLCVWIGSMYILKFLFYSAIIHIMKRSEHDLVLQGNKLPLLEFCPEKQSQQSIYIRRINKQLTHIRTKVKNFCKGSLLQKMATAKEYYNCLPPIPVSSFVNLFMMHAQCIFCSSVNI